jgi:hypothetical protein
VRGGIPGRIAGPEKEAATERRPGSGRRDGGDAREMWGWGGGNLGDGGLRHGGAVVGRRRDWTLDSTPSEETKAR